KQYAISAFGYYLFIPSLSHGYEHAEKYTSEYQIHICSDFYLPFYFETNEYREYVPEDGIYKESEAKELAASHLLTYLEKLREKDVQIIQKNVMIEIDEKNCRASGNITVKEKIGTYAPTEVLAVPAPEIPADEGINTQ
ncbi:MAG: sporulation protein YqfD, partial [Lachnospiraceae bacterium]|nr:sporulation protein YqfD [Lachnospiraceae bacterium]